MEKFKQVYVGGNYAGIYNATLAQLDTQWQAQLAVPPSTLDPASFIAQIQAVAQAYTSYTNASTNGNHANWQAYQYLNAARTAINQGNIPESETELTEFWRLMAE